MAEGEAKEEVSDGTQYSSLREMFLAEIKRLKIM
jgi:hypothetical protein